MLRPESSTEEHAVGDVIAGRYRLDEHIESGGFGAIFRATQLDVGRAVALKLLHRDVLDSSNAVERFLREGRLAQQLEHPNTVRLYDLGQTDSEIPFIAYQLLQGSSLEKLLDAEGPLPPGRVARVAGQVLKSLMEAHESGIVHRDIKPPNIYLVDFQGEPDFVKVLDFGIGKPLIADPNEMDLTRQGEVIGTPSYMSPEQVRGGDVGPQADFYALGLVMAEMLTGRPVFVGSTALELCRAQISGEPVPLGRRVLGSPLGTIIKRATEKDETLRYLHAGEMLADVEEAVATTPATALETPIAGPAAEEWVATTSDKVKTPVAYAGTIAERALGVEAEAPPGKTSTSASPEQSPEGSPEPPALESGRGERQRLIRWTVGAFLGGILFISCALGVAFLIHRAVTPGEPPPATPAAPLAPTAPSPGVPTPITAAPAPRPPPSKLARLTPAMVRSRLAGRGWRIVSDGPSGSHQALRLSLTLTKGITLGRVMMYDFDDPAMAQVMATSFKATPHHRVLIEQGRVLVVFGGPAKMGIPNRALQEQLLSAILR